VCECVSECVSVMVSDHRGVLLLHHCTTELVVVTSEGSACATPPLTVRVVEEWKSGPVACLNRCSTQLLWAPLHEWHKAEVVSGCVCVDDFNSDSDSDSDNSVYVTQYIVCE
jgi:hypothetical protein